MRDDPGIISPPASPASPPPTDEFSPYSEPRPRREHLLALEGVRTHLNGSEPVCAEIDALIAQLKRCLLYTSDAADERSSVDLGGRRIIKKKNKNRIG